MAAFCLSPTAVLCANCQFALPHQGVIAFDCGAATVRFRLGLKPVKNQMAGDEAMVSEIIFLVRESPEGGYEAEALGHAIFTEADTLEELRAMIVDAVQCHFDEDERPRIIRLHFVKEEVLTL